MSECGNLLGIINGTVIWLQLKAVDRLITLVLSMSSVLPFGDYALSAPAGTRF